MLSLFPQLFDFAIFGPFLIRMALGLIFLGHGYSKIKTMEQTTAFFQSAGIKPAKFWASFVGWAEMISGALLIIGLFVQAAAAVIVLIMATAILKVRIKDKFLGGWEFDFLILISALALLVLGPGAFAFDYPL